MKLLILGGSGFLSGTLAREALAQGHEVTIFTRGQKPCPSGTRCLQGNRLDRNAFPSLFGKESWDLVVDSIGFTPGDALQDLETFSGRCGQLLFVSTDFVYHPQKRSLPQREDPAEFATEGYGGDKRRAEEVFLAAGREKLSWIIFRPSHIYGPGSQLGCLPLHGRDPQLLDKLKRRETLRLLGGGKFIQHPVFAPDLARCILSVLHNEKATGQIFNVANPDILPSREYYEIVARILDVPLQVEEENTQAYLSAQPDKAPFCCDRAYDLTRLQQSGLYLPATPVEKGLELHVRSLLSESASS